MNIKTSLIGLISSFVIAGTAQAETPLFDSGRTNGALGASSDWTAITFSQLSAVGLARFSLELLTEQTAHNATQSFSVNGAVAFRGSDTTGASLTFANPFTIDSFAFNSNVGGLQSVSTLTGNAPTAHHAGAYQLFQSNRTSSMYAIGYEDFFNAHNRVGGDFNDMVVRMSVTAVPEPQTFALMGAGFVACFFAARRRKAI